MLRKTAKPDWTSPAEPSRRGWRAQVGHVGLLTIVGVLAALSSVVLLIAVALGAGAQVARRACLAISTSNLRFGPRVEQPSDM